MLRLEEVLQLKSGEEVRLVAKRHAVTVLLGLLLAFLFIVIPFFFLFPLFSFGPIGAVAFLILILIGLIIAWRTFAMWDGDALIVSTHRLVKVVQTGIFARTVNEIPLSSVLEVSWSKKGIFGHICNYGTIRILAGQEMLVKKISQPKNVHAMIMDMVDAAKRSFPSVSVSDNHLREHRIRKIQKMLEEMDDRTLREIERVLGQGERAEAIQQALFQDIRPTPPNFVHAPTPVEHAPVHQYEVSEPRHHEHRYEHESHPSQQHHHVEHDQYSHDESHHDSSLAASSQQPAAVFDTDTDDAEIHIKTLFGEDRTTKLKLMDE